jgi:hypothetical protein
MVTSTGAADMLNIIVGQTIEAVFSFFLSGRIRITDSCHLKMFGELRQRIGVDAPAAAP